MMATVALIVYDAALLACHLVERCARKAGAWLERQFPGF